MNKQRLLEVADAIEKSQTFDMSRYFEELDVESCKTPGCIAGHADVMYSHPDLIGKHQYDDQIGNPSSRAAEALDLDVHQSAALFLDNWSSYEIKRSNFSAQQAAAKLRELAETGVVSEWIPGE